MTSHDESRPRDRGVALWLWLTALRLPPLLVISAVILYLAAAYDAHLGRNYGLDGPHVMSIDIQAPIVRDVNDPPLPATTDAFRESLSGSAGTAVFLGAPDAGIGMGVYDAEGIWPGLPFDLHDYASDARSVSFRVGSAISLIGSESMSLFGTHDVRHEFPDAGTPPYVDFVYPLFSATSVEGRLILSGATAENVNSLSSILAASGYEVRASTSPSFMSQVVHAPITLLVLLVVLLGELAACASWWVQQGRLRLPAYDASGLTGTGRVVARQLWLPTTAWLLAFALTAVPVALISPTVYPSATELRFVALVALGVDLLLGLGLFAVRAYRLARRRAQ